MNNDLDDLAFDRGSEAYHQLVIRAGEILRQAGASSEEARSMERFIISSSGTFDRYIANLSEEVNTHLTRA